MSTKYKFKDQDKAYFVSFATVNWIDVFTRNEYREIMIDSLRFCQKEKGLILYGWCLMTNHVHLLMGTQGEPMEKIMMNLKRFTSHEMRRAIQAQPTESRKEWMLWMMERAGKKNRNNLDWQFWQQDNRPIEVCHPDLLQQKLDYIHNNPVKAGFVFRPEDYPWSSAIDYAGGKGMLDVVNLGLIKV